MKHLALLLVAQALACVLILALTAPAFAGSGDWYYTVCAPAGEPCLEIGAYNSLLFCRELLANAQQYNASPGSASNDCFQGATAKYLNVWSYFGFPTDDDIVVSKGFGTNSNCQSHLKSARANGQAVASYCFFRGKVLR